MEQRKQLGNTSEALAQAYLEKQGFLLLQANFSCKQGELDLIMRRDKLLLFVEVRSKTNQKYGLPLETVTYKKQEKLRKTAEYYLHLHPELAALYCRFDVVSVVWQGENASVQWIADAFQ